MKPQTDEIEARGSPSLDIQQQIHNAMSSHGIFGEAAWFLLMTMADDINADLHGVFA